MTPKEEIDNEDRLDKKINKCVLCGEKAQLEIKDNVWICENCAQIQGELANEIEGS